MKTTLWRLVVTACLIFAARGATPSAFERRGATMGLHHGLLPISTVDAQTTAWPSAGTATLRLGSGQAAAGNSQAGKDLYLRYSCYACHGYAGHGGAGARLVPMRMTLPSFTAYVRNPRQMPPYTAKVLTDAQLADVWAYIQTLPKSPLPKDIPLLIQMLNEK